MIRKLLAALFLLLTFSAFPAAAWFPHGAVGGGANLSPTAIPGNGSTNGIYPAVTTTYTGSPSDYAYNVPVIAQWADFQQITIGNICGSAANPTAGGCVVPGAKYQLGVYAFHQPTNASFAAGNDDDVCSIDVSVDGGATVSIPGASYNANLQEIDWNFTVDPALYSDGVHEVRLKIIPCSGPALFLSGPQQYNNTGSNAGQGLYISAGPGNPAAGNVMTVVNAVQGLIPSTDISARGVENNTRINAASLSNPSLCAPTSGANCTGLTASSPTNATWYVDGPPQIGGILTHCYIVGTTLTVVSYDNSQNLTYPSVEGSTLVATGATAGTQLTAAGSNNAGQPGGGTNTFTVNNSQTLFSAGSPGVCLFSVPAYFGLHGSFLFNTTNKTNAQQQVVSYVQVGGTNALGAGNGTLANPVGSPWYGQAILAQSSHGNSNGGLYGGIVCFLSSSGQTVPYTANLETQAFTGAKAANTKGWIRYVQAEKEPQCGVSGTAPQPVITATNANAIARTGGAALEEWQFMELHGTFGSSAAGGGTWLDNVTSYGVGINNGQTNTNAPISSNATGCTNSTMLYHYSGCRGITMRGNTAYYDSEDMFHDTFKVVNNKGGFFGTVLTNITETATFGSNVLTNVTVSNGADITKIFQQLPSGITFPLAGTYGLMVQYQMGNGTINKCFGGTPVIESIDTVAHTITLVDGTTGSHTSVQSTCPGTLTQSMYADGPHPDWSQWQNTGGQAVAQVIFLNNNFGDGTITYAQGLFDQISYNGMVAKGNTFNSLFTTEQYIKFVGAGYNTIMSNNTWDFQGSSSFFSLYGGMTYWQDFNNHCINNPGNQAYNPAPNALNLSTVRTQLPSTNHC